MEMEIMIINYGQYTSYVYSTTENFALLTQYAYKTTILSVIIISTYLSIGVIT